jgi:aconitate hydratase
LKAKGKCTTDHISPAGVWLKLRGHLDNLSKNMFLGAVNASPEKQASEKSFHGDYKQVHEVAREYKAQGIVGWLSAMKITAKVHRVNKRNGAALPWRQSNYCKSFARIHETNLKKQGMLPLTFANPSDYEKILEDDKIDIPNLNEFAAGRPFTAVFKTQRRNDRRNIIESFFHTGQIEWFKAAAR